jgi:hypothetical protein
VSQAEQIGFNLPNSGPLSPVATMTRIATEGEAMGFDYLTMTDHVVLPDAKVPGYPYSESGEFYEAAPTERHEQLIAMAYIAAKTTRIRLVAAVLVVPHRPAVLAAKMLATLDVMSGGRLVVGVGAGWLKTEFDAVVTTPFPERGAVTDEYIDAFRVLWTESAPKFAGRYTNFDGIVGACRAAPASADLDRRRERAFRAPCRPCRRSLVSDRQQQQASARHAAAAAGWYRPLAPGDARRWSRSCLGGRRLSREALRRRSAAPRIGWRTPAVLG